MFDENVIQKLKQNNISSDGEKTKERVRELWKQTSAEEKQTVERLADVARNTVYRIYKTGSISAKLAVAIAQTLNVNPYYLIGEADERDKCTDELLNDFLVRFGYKELLSGVQKVRKTRAKAKIQPEPEEQAALSEKATNSGNANQEPEIKEVENVSVTMPENKEVENVTVPISETEAKQLADIDDMTEEEIFAIIHADIIRAKYGAKGAAERIKEAKKVLLS